MITGVGPIACNGIGFRSFWSSLVEGRSGISFISLFDTSTHDTKIAGEVKGFLLNNYLRPKSNPRKLSRQTQFAIVGTKLALDDASLSNGQLGNRTNVPVMLGQSTSSYAMIEMGMQMMIERGPSRVPTFIISGSQPQQAASTVAEEFGFSAAAQTFASACPSGLDAIWAAAQYIRSGKGEVVVAGGSDAPISPLGMAALGKAGLVTAQQEDPARASRPFSAGTDSGVMSEGASIVIVEDLEHALERGARIYCEITGYGTCIDAADGEPALGLVTAMKEALANAGRRPQDMDYLCAHGPGHPVLDRCETKMVKRVFGDHAYRIPISSIKGVIGNPLSAAGPLQVAACAGVFSHGMIPPTANLDRPDPECDLDYVPLRARQSRVDRILINAHGLGGGNSCIVLERVAA